MKKLIFPFIISFLFLAACELEYVNNEPGSITLKVTDSPFPLELSDEDNINIPNVIIIGTDEDSVISPFPIDYIEDGGLTITKIVIISSEEDSTHSYILLEDTISISFIELRNGILDELSTVEIPQGLYKEVRVFVLDAWIKPFGYDVFDLKVPSGSSSGIKIKIKPDIRVEGGLTSELLLDFDLSRSFILKGNMNTPAGIKGFNFKPVIHAINNTVAGRLSGMVSDTSENYLANASIILEKDSTVAASFSDANGYYSFVGLTAGDYDLMAVLEGYDTLFVETIGIIEGNLTQQDIVLIPAE